MHLFGGCFDIFPSWIVVVEWCYTITILASLFILYFFSILATLLTTSFCAVFVGFLFMDILGLLGAESKFVGFLFMDILGLLGAESKKASERY